MTRNIKHWARAAGLGALLFFMSTGNVVAVPSSAATDERQCVPTAVTNQVLSCEGAIAIEQKTRSAADVGTSTKKEVKRKKEDAGPSLDRDVVKDILEGAFRQKRKARAMDILLQEIELITRLAKGTADSDPDKPEILKRLADAYKELYTVINFEARGLEEKIFQAKQKGDKDSEKKLRAYQKTLDKKAVSVREAAIKSYVAIRDNFSSYEAYDQILFAIAYEIDQMAIEIRDPATKSAYREQARIYYQQLIQDYPNSQYIPHAWMAYGEYYFHEAKQVDKAMQAYEQVVGWGEKDNPNYVIAMYYQAWCLINMQEPKKAINQFTKVIQYADNNPARKEAASVARRAKLELVGPFSKIGNPNEAWNLFRKIGGDRAHAMLERLAYLYYDEGQWQDAIVVFHQLQKLEKDNYRKNKGEDLCKYQTEITRATLRDSSKEKQVQEISRQISLSQKFAGEGHSKKVVEQCNQETISIAWDIATQWHLETVGSSSAPGTKSPETMALCVDLYNKILESYPNLDKLNVEGFDEKTKPTRYRVAYYRAELYWFMEDWGKCGPAFDDVVEMNPKGVYSSDAAYAAVLCYNKIYVQERAEKDKERAHKVDTDDLDIDKKCNAECRKKKGDKAACIEACKRENRPTLEAKPFTELEEGILGSYRRYVCFVKDAEDLANIKYRRARIYYEANRFAEAAVLFKDIAMNHSDDEIGVFAANLYLDSINALGSLVKDPNPACYDDLAEVVDVFIDTSKQPGADLMKDEQFAAQIKSLKVGVMRKQAESLTERRRFMEAAEIYLDIYRNYSSVYDDRGMCEVLFNTAINLESARLVQKAIDVRKHMVEKYPECEHSKKAAYYIGQNYHALQNYSQAAEYYVKFATQYEGEEESPGALSNAIMFYIGLNRIDDALSVVRKYEKSYARKNIKQTASVVFSAGYVFYNDEKWDETRSWYSSYLKKYRKANLFDEQIQANVMVADSYWNHRKKRDYGKAVKYYNDSIKLFDRHVEKITEPMRKAKAMIATAKAKYYLAELKFQEFQKIKFPEFRGQKGVPRAIQSWWDKKQKEQYSAEELKEMEEWKKQRKRLARWGYWDESKSRAEQVKDVKKEERKEELNIQFEYWTEKELAPWFKKKTEALEEAAKAFGAVAEMHVPEWEMAAAARAADMQLSFMSDIYDSPLPPAFEGDQELIDIYRGAMDEKAEPYRVGAVKAYEHCLNISTKVRWFNENSLRCEKELNKLEPLKYPVSEEIRVTPKTEFEFYAAPAPVFELETEADVRERELTKSADAVAESTEE